MRDADRFEYYPGYRRPRTRHGRSGSRFSLEVAALAGGLIINDIIYAGLSVRSETIEALDFLLASMEIRIEAMPLSSTAPCSREIRPDTAAIFAHNRLMVPSS